MDGDELTRQQQENREFTAYLIAHQRLLDLCLASIPQDWRLRATFLNIKDLNRQTLDEVRVSKHV